ncbi:hypothetical protein B0H13DRAFT_2301064 [Mycena leptocephala]|nr:hypothetical protein B0H13DRAFT_2301064 [Mycena leptocephala]
MLRRRTTDLSQYKYKAITAKLYWTNWIIPLIVADQGRAHVLPVNYLASKMMNKDTNA